LAVAYRIVDERNAKFLRQLHVARHAEHGSLRQHLRRYGTPLRSGGSVMTDDHSGPRHRRARYRGRERFAHPLVGHQPGLRP
jgi:hypothetical protein